MFSGVSIGNVEIEAEALSEAGFGVGDAFLNDDMDMCVVDTGS